MKTLLVTLALLLPAFAAPVESPRPDVLEWVNDASASQLMECPGIGETMAARIIAARPIDSLAKLDAVKGIGPATMAAILKHVDSVQF